MLKCLHKVMFKTLGSYVIYFEWNYGWAYRIAKANLNTDTVVNK